MAQDKPDIFVKPRFHCSLHITVLKPAFNGKWSRCFQKYWNNRGSPEHHDAKQRRLCPGHHCSSSGTNRFSSLRPPGDTVANQHELWPRWSYGDSPLSHGVSWRRAGVAPTLASRTTVCNDGSQWMLVSYGRLRYDYGTTWWTPIEIQKKY